MQHPKRPLPSPLTSPLDKVVRLEEDLAQSGRLVGAVLKVEAVKPVVTQ